MSVEKAPLFDREVSDPEYKIQETMRALSNETIASVTYQRNIVKVKPNKSRRKKRHESNSSEFMSPLSFENIELRNTPLSSLRSCSEYNHSLATHQANAHSNNNNSSGSFWSRLMFWGRSKNASPATPTPSIRSSPKQEKRVRFQELSHDSLDERLYLVERFQFNESNLQEDEISEYRAIQFINQQALAAATPAEARQISALLGFPPASLEQYTEFTTDYALTQHAHRRNPRHTTSSSSSSRSSFFEESSKAVDYLFGYRAAPKEEKKKLMEIELRNLKEPEYFNVVDESVFPLHFSLHAPHTTTTTTTTTTTMTTTTTTTSSTTGGVLSRMNSIMSTTSAASSDYQMGLDGIASPVPSEHNGPVLLESNLNMMSNAATNVRRITSFRSLERTNSMNSVGGIGSGGIGGSSGGGYLMDGYDRNSPLPALSRHPSTTNTSTMTLNTSSSTLMIATTTAGTTSTLLPIPPLHPTTTFYTHHIHPYCQQCYTYCDTNYLLSSRMLTLRQWYTTQFALYHRDFYDALRVQPFSSGAYLRAMLLAGLSSMIFHIYNAITWPGMTLSSTTAAATASLLLTPTQYGIVYFLWIILSTQIACNLILLPFRLRIHFVCWESSRAIEVDQAIELIQMMLRSDSWLLNQVIGRILDILAIISLVIGEGYLWLAPYLLTFLAQPYSGFPGEGQQVEEIKPIDDALRGIIISLCATNLLAFGCRIIIATLYSYTTNDPNIVLEARKRGLSKWDVDNLPTFVFTPPDAEDMTNTDCAICLNSFEMGEMIISLPCDKKHAFHGQCIRQWLVRQNSCPLCQRLV